MLIIRIILMFVLAILLLITIYYLIYHLIGAMKLGQEELKEKSDKKFFAKKIMHRIVMAFARTGKNYTDISMYGRRSIDPRFIALGAVFDLGVQAIDSLDPVKAEKNKLEKQISKVMETLNAALQNAQQHQSLEAKTYVLELVEDLKAVYNGFDDTNLISQYYTKIEAINQQAEIIAQAATFDDAGSDSSGTNSQKQTVKTYYEILEVAKNASSEEIKKAYRRLAKLYHPDRYSHLADDLRQQAENRFKIIQEAYAVLSDPQKRHDYDQTI